MASCIDQQLGASIPSRLAAFKFSVLVFDLTTVFVSPHRLKLQPAAVGKHEAKIGEPFAFWHPRYLTGSLLRPQPADLTRRVRLLQILGVHSTDALAEKHVRLEREITAPRL